MTIVLHFGVYTRNGILSIALDENWYLYWVPIACMPGDRRPGYAGPLFDGMGGYTDGERDRRAAASDLPISNLLWKNIV